MHSFIGQRTERVAQCGHHRLYCGRRAGWIAAQHHARIVDGDKPVLIGQFAATGRNGTSGQWCDSNSVYDCAAHIGRRVALKRGMIGNPDLFQRMQGVIATPIRTEIDRNWHGLAQMLGVRNGRDPNGWIDCENFNFVLTVTFVNHRKIDFVGVQCRKLWRAKIATYRHLRVGMALRKRCQNRGQNALNILIRNADAHGARQRLFAQSGCSLIQQANDTLRIGQKLLASFGQTNAAWFADKNTLAKTFLKLANLHGNGRLRTTKLVSRTGHRAGIDDREKAAHQIAVKWR